MKWRQGALTADAIRECLARAGLLARGPPKYERVPIGQLVLPFPQTRRVHNKWSECAGFLAH